MCGRYTLKRSEQEIAERFQVYEYSDTRLAPRFNIAPTQQVPVVLIENNHRVLSLCKWGLIPSWVKDLSKTKPFINARAETIAEKPSFRTALVKRRCIIPADGFYEWQKLPTGKQPMRILMKDDALFGIAGLWETWTSSDGEVIKTCTIITVPVNRTLADIHDRMPAILTHENEGVWMNPAANDKTSLLEALKPYPDDKITAYPVSSLVNSPKVDSEECIAEAKASPPTTSV